MAAREVTATRSRRPNQVLWEIEELPVLAFVATPGFHNSGISPALSAFVLVFRAVFAGMLCPLFYLFFAVFPVQSPLDRRLPWLKWAGLLLGICTVIPGLRTGDPGFPAVVMHIQMPIPSTLPLNGEERQMART